MHTAGITASARVKPKGQNELPGDPGPANLLAVEFDRLYALVHRFLLHRVFDVELAEELTAQTFLKVAGSVQRIGNDARQLQAWALRIAANTASTHYRRQNLHRILGGRVATTRAGTISSDPATASSDTEQAQRVRTALLLLRPRDQTVLVLRYYLELSHRDIAAVLGCREDAARVRVGRALNRMRSQLD